MWLLTGPFDLDTGDVSIAKTKMLKTGCKVSLGRKDKPLVVNSKKISRDHCEFTVGPCTKDDVSDPSFIPSLEIYNSKDKAMSINRDGQPIVVNPSSSSKLKPGDKIHIVVGIAIEVQWRRITCFSPPERSSPSVSSEDCAALGISLVTSPTSLATHHLTPKYELAVSLATSLLSAAQLVKIEWLQELIRLGTSDDSHPFKLAPLEQSFTPPLESKYRPAFSPSLPPSLKAFRFWEPNEARLHFLKGYRFVLLSGAEGQLEVDARELVTRGGGEYECFPLANGEAKWRQMLAKAKRKVDEAGLKVVIVARERVVQATVGTDKWQEMTTEAQSLSLPLVGLDALVNAVVNTDASLISEQSSSQVGLIESESSLPDLVPNTHPDEPSLPLQPVTVEMVSQVPGAVHRRSPSPLSSSMLYGLPIPPPPSSKLIRRTKPMSTRSCSEEPVVQPENPRPALPSLPEMTRSRLKWRTPVPAPLIDELMADAAKGQSEESQEPPLKKFKALFDASDPDKVATGPQSLREVYDVAMEDSTQGAESVTQSESRAPHSQKVTATLRTLEVVAEEEEESMQSQPAIAPRPQQSSSLPKETQGQPIATQGSRTKGGLTSSKTKDKISQTRPMDTDPVFLTALASRKGKKKTAEDDFDRDFNKLRISRPDIHREEQEQAWEILGDFDAEARNLRGNFMMVVDVDIFHSSRSHETAAVVRRTYDGRPNFKKFKKAPTPSLRAPIELVARGEHEYGMGSGYWKDSTAPKDRSTLTSTQTTMAESQKRRIPVVLESDDGDSDAPAAKRAKKVVRGKQSSKVPTVAAKLFLDSGEEDSTQNASVEEVTRKFISEKVNPGRGNKRRHVIVDDDSDDGVAFKGFGKKSKIR